MNIRNNQGGIVLLVIVLLLATIAIGLVLRNLDAVSIRTQQDNNTYYALREAKASLIGWSIWQDDPGTLPCTSMAADGTQTTAGANCAAYIGRLPWKTIGLPDIRDGYGECLWYALSPIFRSSIAVANRSLANGNQINVNTLGSITIADFDGSVNPPNPVIAVIFSPGRPLAGQNRAGGGGGTCGGNFIPANYLETLNGINNATGNVVGNNYTFIRGQITDNFNDRIITITARDLYRPLRSRMVKEIMGNTNTTEGVAEFFATNGVYPCPAPDAASPSDVCDPPVPAVGRVNNAGMLLNYPSLGAWIANNGWFSIASYTYNSATNVQMTIADVNGTATCVGNANVFNCF